MLALFGLRLIPARQKAAGGKLDPISVGVRAAFKKLLRRHRRRTVGVGSPCNRAQTGQQRAKQMTGARAVFKPDDLEAILFSLLSGALNIAAMG